MKTISIVIGLAALALAGAAHAQSAPVTPPPVQVQAPVRDSAVAATLPNAFTGSQRPAAATPTPAPDAPTSPTPVDPRTEPALRMVIDAVRKSPTLDLSIFSENTAAQMPEQEPLLRALLEGKGELVAIVHRGQQNGADVYQAVFENGDTQWMVGVDEAGKVAVFLFRETPPTPGA